MKAIQIAASIDDPSAGTSYSIRNLTRQLLAAGIECQNHTVDGWRGGQLDKFDDTELPDGVHHRHPQSFEHTPALSQMCSSLAMQKNLLSLDCAGSVFHSHGLWLMPNLYAARAARSLRCPHVVSPRGMLGKRPLVIGKWKKQVSWHLWQRRALAAASAIHATSLQELDDIRRAGLGVPVAVIPNGVVQPPVSAPPVSSDRHQILSLGRIHPKKGLDMLLRAWAQLESDFPHWTLRIAGQDEVGHRSTLEALAISLNLNRVTFAGPLFQQDKWDAMSTADIFAMTSHDENFGLVVVESLASGTPALVTEGAPWQNLDTMKCGWHVPRTIEDVAATLRHAMTLPPQMRHEMGERGRKWVETQYSWSSVAQSMSRLYQWVLGDGAQPDFVDTNA